MFSRFIKELSGLPTPSETDNESDEDRHSQKQPDESQFNQHTQQGHNNNVSHDNGHLSPPRPQTSMHRTPSASSIPGNTSIEHNSNTKNPKWNKFLDTAKQFIDNIIDLNNSDSESSPRKPSSSQHTPQPNATAKTMSPPDYYSLQHHEQHNTQDQQQQIPLGTTVQPIPLHTPQSPKSSAPINMSEPSNILEEHQIRALVAQVPLRYRQSQWKLIYSTYRDGISLQTLLRNARDRSPTVLVVRDQGKSVFGAFCSESWKVSSRYYGTGETFVFQLAPKEVVWHWWWRKMSETQNDFFMWGTHEGIAVGGAGGYALWLDEDLLQGISRSSLTFGNDSLSSSEEFGVGAVELWYLQ